MRYVAVVVAGLILSAFVSWAVYAITRDPLADMLDDLDRNRH